MDNLSGKVLKSYVLGDLIGAGGFGAVYLAHQSVVERDVAIKIIWPVFANHPNFIRRFESEAQLIAGLEHPHIVPLYDYWREPDGAYLVMRWLRGGHLRQKMQDTPWGVSEAGQLLTQVSAALTLAHRLGVVHRDIKPENILLDEDGNAYLADFGIAKILSNAQDTVDEFAAFGSPAYAAPEQVAGQVTTPQADIYSLGVVMFEMLAGVHPFPDMATLSLTELTSERIKEPTPPIRTVRPDLPSSIEDVIATATALKPEDRFSDVLTMARAFRDAINNDRSLISIPRGDVRRRTQSAAMLDDVLPNPYKGLRAFQETDASNFFGREALVQQLVNDFTRTRELSRFLAVVGPSGSGKSSVVKAGLMPVLRHGAIIGSDRWFYVEMVPGAHPFKELQAALFSVAANPPPDLLERLEGNPRGLYESVNGILPEDTATELFLFIDQFEEVFTLVDNESEAARFLTAIHTAVTEPGSRIRVVITLRADFYDRPLLYPNMSELMRKRTEVVVPLTADELERAITGPAQQASVFLEDGLVMAIVSEVNRQPGALPLLQYLLSELFERREGDLMTLDGYRAIGGVRGALAKRADEIYSSFDKGQQEAARQLFLRLITLGEGTEDTRRRALLTEMTSLSNDARIMNTVIDSLGKSRLLAFDRDPITRSPTIEVTHEAIIREWTQLRDWLDASRGDVRMERTLTALSEEWMNSNREASFLLRGARLEQFEKWAQTTEIALTKTERDYLEAGIIERRFRNTEEQERANREKTLERRARTRLRTLVAVLGFAAFIAVTLSLFALSQSQLAQTERDSAQLARATSDSNAALSQSLALEASARQALQEYNGDLAVALALQAVSVPNPSVQSQRTLSDVLFSPGTYRVIGDYSAWVTGVDVSPDGRTILAGSTDATVRLWDRETGQEIRRFTGHRGDVQSVAFNFDGTRAVSGAADYAAIIWDVATGAEVFRLTGHTDPIRSVAFSADGRYVATASSDEMIILWNATTGERLRDFVGHELSVLTVAFSPDNRQLLSGAEDGKLILWDVETGTVIRELLGHATSALSVDFSPDGLTAVSGSTDTSVIVWDVATGQIVRRLQGRGGAVNAVSFINGSTEVISGTIDGVLHWWDIPNGNERRQLNGHTDALQSITASRDGAFLITGAKDARIRVWNLRDSRLQTTLVGHTLRILDETFSADGLRLYTAAGDNSIRVWDTATGSQLEQIDITEGTIRAFTMTPDNSRYLIGLSDGRVIVRDATTVLATHQPHQENVVALTTSNDGRFALSGSADGTLAYFNIETGEVVTRLTGHDGSVFTADISPDGTRAISGARDGVVFVWDLATSTPVYQLVGHSSSVFSVEFSADGSTALSGSRDGSIILWDMSDGSEIRRLLGHSDAVWSVHILPDMQRAVSGSVDQSVILWNLQSGQELQRFSDLDSAVYRIAISTDGTDMVIGQELGVTSLWRLFSLDELSGWARDNRFIRELTCVERDLYRVLPACPPTAG